VEAVSQRLLEVSSHRVRVLVVDDDDVFARALQRVLRVEGFDVDTALDASSALDRLDERAYDVMLLDLRLSSVDGLEIFRITRDRSHPPATILHSAHIDLPTAVGAVRAGVKDVMQKPVPEQVLATRIRELAAERRGFNARPAPPVSPSTHPEALSRLVGRSPPMRELREHIRRVAKYRELSVLIQGPTGTGKELVAQAIHALTCPAQPFVSVNCAAVPENLFESELFGHEAGSFTNAKGSRIGLLEDFSMRLVRCQCLCRPSCCACSRRDSSDAWVATEAACSRRAS
jgi:two-component system, NtrC family, C4-dicarboxylate transport response regulator DctD